MNGAKIALSMLACGLSIAAACGRASREQASPDLPLAAPSLPSSSAPVLEPHATSTAGAAASAQPDPPERPSEASRCGDLRRTAAPRPAVFETARRIRSQAEVSELVAAGRDGRPRSIAARVAGTFGAGCECPPFSAWFSSTGEGLAQWIIPVPDPGVPDIGTFRTNLEFIVVGYFSGAIIDTFEYFRATDLDAPTPDDEERYTWKQTHPEFCLQAWCYAIPPPSPGDDKDDSARFLHGVSAEHAASMVKLGVPRCQRAWVPRE